VKIVSAFDLAEEVKIKELNQNGRIMCFFVDSGGMQIKVRYFHNGEAKEVYFLEDELVKK